MKALEVPRSMPPNTHCPSTLRPRLYFLLPAEIKMHTCKVVAIGGGGAVGAVAIEMDIVDNSDRIVDVHCV